MTTATPHRWDFFIAHAGADTPIAEELYDHLRAHARVFVDSRTIAPGEAWDAAIQSAQRASLVSVILVSSSSGGAYYQRAEIAAAISMARKDKDRHHCIPLFIDVDPSADGIPYGLALLHGLRLSPQLTLAGAAAKLIALFRGLRAAANSSGPPSKQGFVDGTGIRLHPPVEWKSPVVGNRHRFKLAAFDFDGTLLRGESFDYMLYGLLPESPIRSRSGSCAAPV